jgi:hypothetical protein
MYATAYEFVAVVGIFVLGLRFADFDYPSHAIFER